MSYKGKDLSIEFKRFFRAEKKRITNVLTSLGCTDIVLDYGFHYFSGFFVAPSKQMYYLCSLDTRGGYRMYYRTAKHNKDYTGGSNQWVDVKKLDFKLD